MVAYVAFVAILNLALGYALAVYLGAGGRRKSARRTVRDEASHSDEFDREEYESEASYEESRYAVAAH